MGRAECLGYKITEGHSRPDLAEEQGSMIRVKKSEADVAAEDYHRALHGQYRVWMMTSDGAAAQLVEYEMDQEAIEEFLEDYTRFADLLVRIEVKENLVDAHNVSETVVETPGAD